MIQPHVSMEVLALILELLSAPVLKNGQDYFVNMVSGYFRFVSSFINSFIL